MTGRHAVPRMTRRRALAAGGLVGVVVTPAACAQVGCDGRLAVCQGLLSRTPQQSVAGLRNHRQHGRRPEPSALPFRRLTAGCFGDTNLAGHRLVDRPGTSATATWCVSTTTRRTRPAGRGSELAGELSWPAGLSRFL